jgi:gamma-D-glutamyl-L-lysine dipeptidyl-peptidase
MKVVLLFTFIAVVLLLSCHSSSVEPLQGEINAIAKRWVPDKRVGICSFTLLRRGGDKMVLKGESLIPEARSEVLALLKSKGISVTDSSVMLPDTVQNEKSWGIIDISVANLRSRPAHPAELVSQAIMGTPVRVLKEDDGWILIQTPDHYIAWTNNSSVQRMSFPEINNWRNSDRLIYKDSYGTVYKDIMRTMIMSDLVAGAIVIKKSGKGDVSEVCLPDGRNGYVSNQNWMNFKQWKDTVSLISDKMIATGNQFLGFPYLWGGTSSKAMDCSGFVKTVCFLNGVILERDASQQFMHGKEIDITSGWDKLQKGDLLFFGSKQPFHVTHVGMYIGDSEVINSSGYVRIGSLDRNRDNFSDYLSSTLIGAKRIIGFNPEQGYLPVKLHNWY